VNHQAKITPRLHTLVFQVNHQEAELGVKYDVYDSLSLFFSDFWKPSFTVIMDDKNKATN